MSEVVADGNPQHNVMVVNVPHTTIKCMEFILVYLYDPINLDQKVEESVWWEAFQIASACKMIELKQVFNSL